MFIGRFPDIFEWGAAERAEKIAFILAVVAIEVGKNAFKLINVKYNSLLIVKN